MSERMIERDERGRDTVYAYIPRTPQWNKHINNLVERER